MTRAPSFQWVALRRLGTQLSLGLIPFILFALAHPDIPHQHKTTLAICLALLGGIHLLLRLTRESTSRFPRPIWHQLLSCLLVGSSFAAIPWKMLGFPLSIAVITIGFSIRWMLYAVETWELRIEDSRKAPMPCLATRIRRGITFISGALIPLLILAGLPIIPLLGLSFVLTALSQWSASCEMQINAKPFAQ
jgi:hypothetical protein